MTQKTHEQRPPIQAVRKRRELFDAQDKIEAQRDVLIGKIEMQMKQKQTCRQIFTVQWRVE